MSIIDIHHSAFDAPLIVNIPLLAGPQLCGKAAIGLNILCSLIVINC